jgi:hypothetical protein
MNANQQSNGMRQYPLYSNSFNNGNSLNQIIRSSRSSTNLLSNLLPNSQEFLNDSPANNSQNTRNELFYTGL